MTRRRLDPKLKKFKAYLLSGNSIASASKEMGIGRTTGYTLSKKLEYLGEIRRIPGTVNPIVWEDGKKPFSGSAGYIEKTEHDYGVVTSDQYGLTSRPEKFVRAHISGAYVTLVETVGERGGRIVDGEGYTIGGWQKDERLIKRTRVHDGFLYGHHEMTKFILYLASEGPKLNIYPRPRQVYYKSATVDGPRAMENQCLEVCRVLERHGWKFATRPALAGVMHYGDIDPRLLGLADPMTDFDGDPVHTDTSPGTPEVEIYGDSPTAQRDIVILSELPDRIVQITNTLAETTHALMQISDGMDYLSKATIQLQQSQTTILEILARDSVPFRAFDGVGYQ